MSKAHYLADRLCEIDGYELVYKGEFFNEFVTTVNTDTDKVFDILSEHGILGGYPLDGKHKGCLFCIPEVNTRKKLTIWYDLKGY